jgi:hypothetical protein
MDTTHRSVTTFRDVLKRQESTGVRFSLIADRVHVGDGRLYAAIMRSWEFVAPFDRIALDLWLAEIGDRNADYVRDYNTLGLCRIALDGTHRGMIMLDSDRLLAAGPETMIEIVLHEFAHICLGHIFERAPADLDYLENEKDANRLVVKWIEQWKSI